MELEELARCCARPWVKSLGCWSEMADRPVHPLNIDLPPPQTVGQPLIKFLSSVLHLVGSKHLAAAQFPPCMTLIVFLLQEITGWQPPLRSKILKSFKTSFAAGRWTRLP